ncbi:GNAT family N-acetyltransferase [uncultured Amnibacterium sp.]|uniref:GNAT family N-acetyltransferase n=1 Tax=uncultured Amnibacterium sp. TaxID=1631851 RepID=UPI0035C9A8C1
MKPVEIRAPRSEDMRALAQLKIEWAMIDPPPNGAAVWKFADDLASWLDRMGDRVICRVAAIGDELVGMTWLVVYERVPNFDARKRRAGDVQSTYVVPRRRGRGIGTALVRSVCDEADRRGIPRVTVASSAAAVPVYEAAGFQPAATLLDRHLPGPDPVA